MTELPARFLEDRALRNKARAILADDIERLRGSLDEEGIASRVSSGVTTSITTRIRTGARDVFEQARAQANDSKGVLALLVGAIILWVVRGPIIEWIEELRGEFEEPVDDAAAPASDDTSLPEAAPAGDPE